MFHSIHSLIGFFTLSLFCINYIHGLLVYLLGLCGNHQCGCFGNDASSKSVHKRVGLVVLIGGGCNILIGITEKMGTATGNSLHVAQAIAALVFIAIVGVIFTLTRFQDKSEEDFSETERILVM